MTFTSARPGGKQQQVSQPKMACVLDTDNKVGSHCGLSVVGKALDVHPYALDDPVPTAAFRGRRDGLSRALALKLILACADQI